jgi:hypothetical protein
MGNLHQQQPASPHREIMAQAPCVGFGITSTISGPYHDAPAGGTRAMKTIDPELASEFDRLDREIKSHEEAALQAANERCRWPLLRTSV